LTASTPSSLLAFHAAHPGITARALWRGGSYHRLAAHVPAGSRVLDLGCGDGALVELLTARGGVATGVDISPHELAAARVRDPRGTYVRARAQALPFVEAAFDHVVSHLAFTLMDDAAAIAGELARVLRPGGTFVALVGGGPVADGEDAFPRFLARAAAVMRGAPRFGDRQARSEAGWRALFAGWDVAPFERVELDLGGSFDEVWTFLGSSYELHGADAGAVAAIREALRAELGEGRVPCRVVTWLGRATRTTFRR